jgi:polyhydroxyalkanoate synthesis regulator protein
MLHEITKYKNRKLYSKELKKYITLETIKSIVENGESILVINSVDKTDVTKEVLVAALKHVNVTEMDLARFIRENRGGQFSENTVIQ